jgi:hypothetical protein
LLQSCPKSKEEEITTEEKENILSSQTAYLSGDYLTLDQYEATQA